MGFNIARAVSRPALFAVIAAASLASLACTTSLADPKPSSSDLEIEPIVVQARAVSDFDRSEPGRVDFGRLSWRGGLVLTSPSRNFGGWSALALGPGGKSLLAVSDAGAWMTAKVTYDGERPSGLTDARMGPLLTLGSKNVSRGRDRDAEGLAMLSGTPERGEALISFERYHRIGRFDVDGKGLSAPKEYLALPKAASRMKGNSGLEAIAVLRAAPHKGSLVAFAERLRDKTGNHTGWIWIKGQPREIYLTNPSDFDVTDAAGTPDGGLLVLERRFRWSEGVQVRLRHIAAAELKPGARIAGEMLLTANMSREIDNMEGIAVHAGERGETVLTMISDDNFNKMIQRTILLQFTLDGAASKRAGD